MHVINVPVYCGNRFCPVCSAPRRSRIRKRLQWLVGQVDRKPGFRMKHLTLTIPNQVDLPKMLKHLLKSFRKLRSTPFWKNHVDGGAFVLEVTGKEGDWHGHIHIVIHATYVDWDTLKNLWIRFSKGRGVWIKALPVSAVVRYLCKYLSKPDLPDTSLALVNVALKGFRMFQPFGTWYALSNAYVKPLSKCSHCGAMGQFDLYYSYFGGQIRIEMTDEEARNDARASPDLDTAGGTVDDTMQLKDCPF